MTEDSSRVGDLAERAQAGSRSSFEQLIHMFQDKIFRMVYYRIGSRMDAEDLTQDIFEKALRNLKGLREVKRFRPWLFSIAVNRVRDFKRKKRVLVFLGGKDERENLGHEDRVPHNSPQTLRHLLRREFWEQMRNFLDKLGRSEREVFILRFLDQLSIREITHVLHKSESAVKTHLYRSLYKFKRDRTLVRMLEGINP